MFTDVFDMEIELIKKNHWVTEEGNNLKAMVESSSYFTAKTKVI